MRSPGLVCLLFLLLPASLSSQPRSLYWKSLEVTARLDEEGRLHVVERHAMIFTGDWNGGERTFRLAPDHRLELQSIEREDFESHTRIPLRQNELISGIDDYAWTDPTTLRWRSRLPTDPSFENSERVYVLEYVLENVLIPTDEGYLLDHDFAFPDRPGPILSFSLDLSWDGSWSPAAELPGRLARENLPPGAGVVVRAPLLYQGEGSPSGVRTGAAYLSRALLGLAFAGAAFAIGVLFYRGEKDLGRFAPLTPLTSIDPSWLEANLFSMLPEEAGAAWDDSTGAPEVGAVLARMVSEGKLKTEVYRTPGVLRASENLRMELLVDRNTLSGYESSLVRALFVSGDVTDTEKIRKHYRNRGFDPSAILTGPLTQRLAKVLKSSKARRRISKKPAFLLFLASVVLIAVEALTDPAGLPHVLGLCVVVVPVYLVGLLAALAYRKRVVRLLPWSLSFLLPAALIAAIALAFLYANPSKNGALALAGLASFALALLTSLFNAAKFRAGALAIDVRKKLASARRYFAWELSKRHPHIDDRWFPYLVALELGPNVDRWFRSFGSLSSDGPAPGGSISSGGGSSGRSSPTWTGGGGAFGGAGATGSWAAAVSTVASGVAAPSESSSGGSGGGSSGGGGGGSSGGGGGGGW
jgi:uncharacterized membrane protein YgcG